MKGLPQNSTDNSEVTPKKLDEMLEDSAAIKAMKTAAAALEQKVDAASEQFVNFRTKQEKTNSTLEMLARAMTDGQARTEKI